MRLAICTVAFIVLGPGTAMAQDAPDWRNLHSDEIYDLALDDASLQREGDRVLLTFRLVRKEAAEVVTMVGVTTVIGHAWIDCHYRTFTMTGGRTYDADGVPLQRITISEDFQNVIPIFRGDGASEQLYVDQCPGSGPLPEHGPAVITLPVRD